MNKPIALLLFTCLVWTQAYAGGLYKWVDEEGNVSYHDRPPPAGGEYVLQSTNFKYGQLDDDAQLEARTNALKNFPVTLYIIQKCASCDLARDYLKKKNIPFKEKDVGVDESAGEELIKMTGGKAVPTVRVGEQAVRGFAQSEIETQLTQAGYFGPPKDEDEEADAQFESDSVGEADDENQ